MKFLIISAALCCCLLLCVSAEASSLLMKIKNGKINLDDINTLTDDTPSPYSYLEGKSEIEEPRFLQQVPQAAEPAAASTTPVLAPAGTPASMNPVFVASSPPGVQLTRIPSTAPTTSQTPDEEADPETAKLSAALEAVKEDIVGNSKQIVDEKKWVTAVSAITQSYEDKMKRVSDHIMALRKEQRKLFDKKKQIENLKLQKRLQSKLGTASEELKTLQTSLDSVQQKSHELNTEQSNLKGTIAKIEQQLTKLKGSSPVAEPDAAAPAAVKKDGDKEALFL